MERGRKCTPKILILDWPQESMLINIFLCFLMLRANKLERERERQRERNRKRERERERETKSERERESETENKTYFSLALNPADLTCSQCYKTFFFVTDTRRQISYTVCP
jgi:hypothetical protein